MGLWDDVDSLDKRCSHALAVCANHQSPYYNHRWFMRLLEISCHGVPWLAFAFFQTYMHWEEESADFYFNMLLGLVLDLVLMGVIKPTFSRQRPAENGNDMFLTVSVDRYSFPSGHATRCTMLALLYWCSSRQAAWTAPVSRVLGLGVVTWSLMVSLSRVVLGRHHVLDVVAGQIIGVAEYLLLDALWLDKEFLSSYLPFQSTQ